MMLWIVGIFLVGCALGVLGLLAVLVVDGRDARHRSLMRQVNANEERLNG